MSIKPFLLASIIALLPAFCMGQSANVKTPSDAISTGAVSILVSPAASVAASVGGDNPSAGVALAGMGSMLIVAGIVETGKDAVDVLLTASQSAGKASLKMSKEALKQAGLSVGQSVNVVAQSTGTALVASGKVLAFVPNAAGEALLHHARVPGESPAPHAQAAQ